MWWHFVDTFRDRKFNLRSPYGKITDRRDLKTTGNPVAGILDVAVGFCPIDESESLKLTTARDEQSLRNVSSPNTKPNPESNLNMTTKMLSGVIEALAENLGVRRPC